MPWTSDACVPSCEQARKGQASTGGISSGGAGDVRDMLCAGVAACNGCVIRKLSVWRGGVVGAALLRGLLRCSGRARRLCGRLALAQCRLLLLHSLLLGCMPSSASHPVRSPVAWENHAISEHLRSSDAHPSRHLSRAWPALCLR